MRYEAQLEAKTAVIRDQLHRIGGLKKVTVKPPIPHPTPWEYRHDVELSPVTDDGLGFWSPGQRRVIPIKTCPILHPRLLALWQDFDLDLPGLRKLTLRLGDDEALLAALAVDDVEPPQLEADFPISVAIVMPNHTAANLVGDNFVIKRVHGRDFRVSPGCFFQPSPLMAGKLVDVLLDYAALSGSESVLELYSGVGMLTAFLAEQAAQVTAVEMNRDAVADTAVNLDEFDNVTLYQGKAEEIVPMLKEKFDVLVINPPASGMSNQAIKVVRETAVSRLIYASADVATLARDSKRLRSAGYWLEEVQPVDMTPQTFHVNLVAKWIFKKG
ncbi:MAG: class I SAM-dependent RNA methyltransferase, partial [Anaerolineae bacterium]